MVYRHACLEKCIHNAVTVELWCKSDCGERNCSVGRRLDGKIAGRMGGKVECDTCAAVARIVMGVRVVIVGAGPHPAGGAGGPPAGGGGGGAVFFWGRPTPGENTPQKKEKTPPEKRAEAPNLPRVWR